MSHSSFRDLRVWQEAMRLTAEIYKSTANFPKHEQYGLTQQIRRAAVSVPSNIAEGKGHHPDKEFVRFLLHARGSPLELQTQLLIAEDLVYLSKDKTEMVGRALNGLINSMTKLLPEGLGQRPMTNDQRRVLAFLNP